ncbi:hypothetical protein SRHO_G00021740 [Serrasalmus rhombeus]
MISVGKSAVKSFLPTLIHTLGMEAVLTAEDPFQKEVPLNKSNSSENHEASPSSDQRNGRIEDSSHSTPDLKECEGNVLTAKSERFLSKATQVVSDLLVRSDRCSTSTSTGSSKEIHDAAVNIAETVVEALDKLVESSVIDSQSDSEAIIRSLEASTHTLNRSDISEGRVPSTSLFRRVRGYVQALFTSLKPDEQTAASIQEAPVSDLQRSKDHTVSQLDDLTITCTNNIIEMSGKRKHAQKQPGTKTTVEDTAGKPPQDPPPPEKLKCFQDILDIVCGLSDEEWRALTSDAPHARSKAEFASLCTNIMISVGKSAVKSFLPTLIHTLGMEAVLTAEEQLRKRTQSESRSPSGQSTTPTKPAASSHDSDERSTVEPSAFICTMIEDFISEVKVGMQEAICKLASCKAFSKSWEPKQSPMAEEMPNVLSELFKKSEREDAPSTGRKMHRAKQETERDIADITGKIVVVVLDHMDGVSVDRTDLRTSDLLNAAAEKIKQIIEAQRTVPTRGRCLSKARGKMLRSSRQRPPDL